MSKHDYIAAAVRLDLDGWLELKWLKSDGSWSETYYLPLSVLGDFLGAVVDGEA